MARTGQRALPLALALAAAGCLFRADYEGTEFRCDARCPAGLRCLDGTCREDGPDAAPDARPPDGALSVCDLAAAQPENDRCDQAIDLTAAALGAAGATVHGDTSGHANHAAPSVIATCTAPLPMGPDAIYRIVAQAGDRLELELVPDGWDAALYVTSACSQDPACLGGTNVAGAGAIETLDLTIAQAGTHYVVVDSAGAAHAGCFTLTAKLIR